MKSGEYSTRECIDILMKAGFKFHRNGKGDHAIYIRGKDKIALPVAKKSVNRMLFKRICKQNNISIL